ncbi:MAG TPA: hypothetical protein VEK57_21390 [Thermoanaerobaculia bacterium]|nr:hypothetical protein [Thermoanaerobaculia bacterium]
MLGDLTALLLDATRGALRLRVEGRSTARGSLPSWLGAAAEFEVVGIEGGSTVLVIEAPTLLEAAPGLFGQQALFEPIDAADSAFGVMEQTLRAAVAGRSDSDLFDQPLLATFRRFERILAAGFSSVELTDGEISAQRIVVDANSVAAVDRLIRTTPEPQRARVSGTLDTIRHSDRMFTLLMDDGKAVKGIAEGLAAEQLAGLFGQKVVVAGTAVFRPSGALLRIEADAIDSAGPEAAVWARVPAPLFRGMDAATMRQPQGLRSGVNAIIGRWPGEESDEQVAAALEALS